MQAGVVLAVTGLGATGRVGLGVAVAVVAAGLYDLGYILEKRALSALTFDTAAFDTAAFATAAFDTGATSDAPGARRLLARAIRSRQWVAGFVSMLAGLGLQVVALTLAPVSVVQPVLAGGIVALVVISRSVLGERLAGRERTAGLLVLGAVIAIAISAGGTTNRLTRHVPGPTFAVFALAVGAAAAALLLGGRRFPHSSPRGLALLALAAGLWYGLGSVAQKAVATEMVRRGLVSGGLRSLASPYPWVFVIATAAGLVAFQLCLQRHPASLVAPLANVVSGTCAVLGASAVFSEALIPGGWWALPRIVGFAGIVVAVAVLGARGPHTATVPSRRVVRRVEPAA
jgi:multidrug transporter EmrE-like cation transporter